MDKTFQMSFIICMELGYLSVPEYNLRLHYEIWPELQELPVELLCRHFRNNYRFFDLHLFLLQLRNVTNPCLPADLLFFYILSYLSPVVSI